MHTLVSLFVFGAIPTAAVYVSGLDQPTSFAVDGNDHIWISEKVRSGAACGRTINLAAMHGALRLSSAPFAPSRPPTPSHVARLPSSPTAAQAGRIMMTNNLTALRATMKLDITNKVSTRDHWRDQFARAQ
jgi:hypothetical protein